MHVPLVLYATGQVPRQELLLTLSRQIGAGSNYEHVDRFDLNA